MNPNLNHFCIVTDAMELTPICEQLRAATDPRVAGAVLARPQARGGAAGTGADAIGGGNSARSLSVPHSDMSQTDPNASRNAINVDVIQQFHNNNGKIESGMFKGARLLLLTTTGARSGQTRVNPLAFTQDGDNYVVIASKGGAPSHPDWYHNVVANPDVHVEVSTGDGVKQFEARARVAQGEERERLYAAQAKIMPGFAEYQRKTSRQIPVVVLEPR